MNYLYAALAGIAMGWVVHGWYTDASEVHAIQKRDSGIAQQNQHTETRTLAAAIHVEAIHAQAQDLHAQIHKTFAGGGHHDAAPAPSTLAVCPDPFTGAFRVLYDAGSAAQPKGKTDDVLSPAPSHP